MKNNLARLLHQTVREAMDELKEELEGGELDRMIDETVEETLSELSCAGAEANIETRLGRALLAKKYTIACAESCTGGLVTSRLTDVPGSSAYVMGSVVSYTNQIKEKLVGVSHETLAAHGAVSEETAREMAEGIRRVIGTDIGVGITGIAGPGGGTAEKPVGLVYIAVAGAYGTVVRENHFTGTRKGVKRQTSETALEMALAYIQS